MENRQRTIITIQNRINEARNNHTRVATVFVSTLSEVLALLKEQESLLGIHQTANGITFISTGTAQQGEERGILLGKSLMHEWIYKELLHKGLLTDDIRSVLEQAKRI